MTWMQLLVALAVGTVALWVAAAIVGEAIKAAAGTLAPREKPATGAPALPAKSRPQMPRAHGPGVH